MKHHQETDYKRLALAIFLAAILLMGWQAFVQMPRKQHLGEYVKTKQVEETKKKEEHAKEIITDKEASAEENPNLSDVERLALSPRITVATEKLHGSISLKGARFDDLKLANYRTELAEKSPEVTLLAPNGSKNSYFAEAGWLASDNNIKVPTQNTIWTTDKKTLAANEPVTLSWNNGEGISFFLEITLDSDYMFSIKQRVENKSSASVSLIPYAYINRVYGDSAQHYGILHEGPMGVMDKSLTEVAYQDLRDKGNQVFENAAGWLGITDKYWLAALIPSESGYKATFAHYNKRGADRYQVDYLGNAVAIKAGETQTQSVRLFAGAKEIEALDRYTKGDGKDYAPVPLFDRAVDFGILYFMTKPMFLALKFFHMIVGNFGIAIMLLTILVKLLMFPLANKSYHSMAQMRAIQPQMLIVRERYAGDSVAMNKEMMALYKREKVNPAAGCLPVILQMPVFFALYKVLYVTIEMRHAPFFGWLKDLSATDPSNIFTLFGLIPWDHPHALHIGVLPILFCFTMVIQMKQQPKPTDPIQAKMIAIMPYFFLYLFASFPAGLVLYWVWSNMLSILQQHLISRRHNAKLARKAAA